MKRQVGEQGTGIQGKAKERPRVVERPKKKFEQASGVTSRAVSIGAVGSVLLAFLDICQQALGGGGSLTADGYGAGALFLLFALICGIGLLKRFGFSRHGLEPQEILVIFSMLLMVSAVSTGGLLISLIPHIAGFANYATPENEWGSKVLPLLPDGIVIKDRSALKGFFEGLGPGEPVPYGAWISPLCAWLVLLSAFYFTTISIVVILRKRWVEQERLSFPLAQLPLTMVAGEPGDRPLLHNGIFWFGFGVSGLVGSSSSPLFRPSTSTSIRVSIAISSGFRSLGTFSCWE